ncbi:hypothetical protein V8C86DRAFT_2763109 [Haematococcus lacustris]
MWVRQSEAPSAPLPRLQGQWVAIRAAPQQLPVLHRQRAAAQHLPPWRGWGRGHGRAEGRVGTTASAALAGVGGGCSSGDDEERGVLMRVDDCVLQERDLVVAHCRQVSIVDPQLQWVREVPVQPHGRQQLLHEHLLVCPEVVFWVAVLVVRPHLAPRHSVAQHKGPAVLPGGGRGAQGGLLGVPIGHTPCGVVDVRWRPGPLTPLVRQLGWQWLIAGCLKAGTLWDRCAYHRIRAVAAGREQTQQVRY